MPGPVEADVDQVHNYMRVVVNELLRLWEDGVVIKTPKHPNGRLVRVILVVLACDKPAAHKLGGFGSHAHRLFCTKCWVSQADKATPKSFLRDGFRQRTDKEHRAMMDEYLKCGTATARAAFVTLNATRYAELSRLPYFDICQMVVIDPMHNLFLGKPTIDVSECLMANKGPQVLSRHISIISGYKIISSAGPKNYAFYIC